VIDGSVSVEKRQKMIDDLKSAPEGAVLSAQITAGGTGLNIQAASVVERKLISCTNE
jgi:SNF2 family DNA or RNA helicase